MNSELRNLYIKIIGQVTEIKNGIIKHLPDMIAASTNEDFKKLSLII